MWGDKNKYKNTDGRQCYKDSTSAGRRILIEHLFKSLNHITRQYRCFRESGPRLYLVRWHSVEPYGPWHRLHVDTSPLLDTEAPTGLGASDVTWLAVIYSLSVQVPYLLFLIVLLHSLFNLQIKVKVFDSCVTDSLS